MPGDSRIGNRPWAPTDGTLTIVDEQAGSPFGTRLRQWRQQRGLSQLALAGRVGSTSRHISFLETGRSRPSRQMTLRLADALDVGRREANRLLHAAGLPATYSQAALDGADLGQYRATIQRMLAAHEPYPGLVLDGHFTVLLANDACARLFGTDLVGVNFVRDALTNPVTAGMIVNWAEVAWAGLDRLRRHHERNPFDDELHVLVAAAEAVLDSVPRPATETSAMVCPTFRIGDDQVRTVAMVARFDQAADVTLDELRVELIYPFDEAADRFFRNDRC
jgi:transcriptional regulator with XRE-family HTH domain